MVPSSFPLCSSSEEGEEEATPLWTLLAMETAEEEEEEEEGLEGATVEGALETRWLLKKTAGTN